MAEHDDRELSARYRALGDEAPPAALDAAVLAAARAAVAPRPATALRRWSVPVSLAAVVVLSVVVTLRVEEERPDLAQLREQPAARKAAEPVPSAPPVDRAVVEAKRDAVTQLPAAPPETVAPAPAGRRAEVAPAPAGRHAEVAPAPAGRNGEIVPAAPAGTVSEEKVADLLRKREADAATARAPVRGFAADPPAAARDDVASSAAARPSPAPERMESRLRAAQAPAESPQDWLERIARLRREGRTEEADKALDEFRRRYPDFEIPEAQREAVLGKR